MSSAAIDPSSIVIGQRPARVGELRRHRREVRLDALLAGGGLFAPSAVALEQVAAADYQERVLAVDAAGHPCEVELTYLRSVRNDPRVAGSALLPDAAAGRRLKASAPERGPLVIEALDLEARHEGSSGGVDAELAARVGRDVRGLGRAPLFSRFHPGGALAPGQRLELSAEVARGWFALAPGLEATDAVAVYLGRDPQGCAVFEIGVRIHGDLGAQVRVDARLTGRVGVDPASAERLSADLSGPVELEVEGHLFGFAQRLAGHGTLHVVTRCEVEAP